MHISEMLAKNALTRTSRNQKGIPGNSNDQITSSKQIPILKYPKSHPPSTDWAKVISEASGHSSVAFTMDVYSHIIEGMQEDATTLLDEILPAGKNGASQQNNGSLTATSGF